MMNDDGLRSRDFGREQYIALLLAGTVALPSPFPAVGRVSFIAIRRHWPDHGGELQVFVKSVQSVNERNVITRIVPFEAVRAIGFFTGGRGAGDGEYHVVPFGRQFEKVGAALREISELAERSHDVPHEREYLPAAVVYVPETTSVLHRQDMGLTAALSGEAFGMFAPFGSETATTCCCKP